MDFRQHFCKLFQALVSARLPAHLAERKEEPHLSTHIAGRTPPPLLLQGGWLVPSVLSWGIAVFYSGVTFMLDRWKHLERSLASSVYT
jgi:hypothetical protein